MLVLVSNQCVVQIHPVLPKCLRVDAKTNDFSEMSVRKEGSLSRFFNSEGKSRKVDSGTVNSPERVEALQLDVDKGKQSPFH